MRGGEGAVAALAVQALGLALVAIDGRRRIVLANSAFERIVRAGGPLTRRRGRLCGRDAGENRALDSTLKQLRSQRAAIGRFAGVITFGVPLRRRDLMLLLLVDMQRPLACTAEQVAGLFGLSPAEARLAYALASGKTLLQHAKASNVALSTVRTQLRCVLKKSSLHRQSDLVRTIAGLPALRPAIPLETD